jgi:hypothetical protein
MITLSTARRRIGDRAEHHGVDLRLARIVVREGLEGQAILLRPFLQLVRARAHRLQAEFGIADGLHIGLVEDEDGGQIVRQSGIGAGRRDLDGEIVDRRGAGDVGREVRHHRGLQAVDGEHHVGRLQRFAIVKLHARPELEQPGLLVLLRPAFGKARAELEVRVAPHQRVVDVVEHDVAGQLLAGLRVEDGRVRGQADRQVLGVRQGGEGQRQRERGGGEQVAHREV